MPLAAKVSALVPVIEPSEVPVPPLATATIPETLVAVPADVKYVALSIVPSAFKN